MDRHSRIGLVDGSITAMIRHERMTPGGLRRLTAAEAGLAREMFGERLDPVRVRLFALPVWSRAFVAGARLMVWPARGALCDFAAPDVPLDLQAVFVHELTHVWQAQSGVNLLTAKLRAGDGPAAYAYDLGRGPAFMGLNIEQQAMLVQHAFMASRGGSAPYPHETYRAMASAWRGSASA